MTTRMSELLRAAASTLEDGSDPFHVSFLSEHEVTSGECLDLADFLALGAQAIAWGLENPKDVAALIEAGVAGVGLRRVTEALEKLR